MPLPFGLKLKRTRRYTVSSKSCLVARIQLLNNEFVEFTLSVESTGQESLEAVAQRLELREVTYFSLWYYNKQNQRRWVDLEKPLKKQLDKHALEPTVYFGVLFYVPSVSQLQQEITRYQYYLQLKKDILEGNLPCTLEHAIQLAGLAVQADFGDFDQYESQDFLQKFALLPVAWLQDEKVLEEAAQKVALLHQKYRGLTAPEAELLYMQEVERMDGYGEESYPAKDSQGSDISIGACLDGIFVKHKNGRPPVVFRWHDIANMSHNKSFFALELANKEETIQFQTEDMETAKYVWRLCVARHKFYRLNQCSLQTQAATLNSVRRGSSSRMSLPKPQPYAMPPPPQLHYNGHYTEPFASSQDNIFVPNKNGFYCHSQTSLDRTQIDLSGRIRNGSVYSAHSTNSLNTLQPYLQPSPMSSNPSITGSDVMRPDYIPSHRHSALIPPSYRPTPDYETVMKQLNRGMVHADRHSHSLRNLNIGSSYAYSRPDALVYSQPEIREHPHLTSPQSAHYPFNLNYSFHSQSPYPYPAERRPVVGAVSVPELTNVQLQAQDYPAPNIMRTQVYRPPPPYPYPRPANSTPDLSRHLYISSSNPDLITRRVHHSVQTFQEDSLPVAHSLQEVSEPLTAARHAHLQKRNSIEIAGLTHGFEGLRLKERTVSASAADVAPRTFSAGSQSSVFSDKMKQEGTEEQEGGRYSHKKSLSDATMLIHSSEEDEDLEEDSSREQAISAVSEPRLTAAFSQELNYPCASATPITGPLHIFEPKPHVTEPEKRAKDISPVHLVVETHRPRRDGLLTPSMSESDLTTSGRYRARRDSVKKRPVSDLLSGKKSAVEGLPPLGGMKKTRADAKKIGPLKLAALNGLSLSRLPLPDEGKEVSTRATNDERCKVLEQRLEQGMVFTEYERILKKRLVDGECSTARLPENAERNRFQDVLPYDDARVELVPTKENNTGYINASHIKVSVSGIEWDYIATQGPLQNTCQDFWQMVWEQGVAIIAMVTAEEEGGREKSFRYWPRLGSRHNTVTYGRFKITTRFRTDSGCYATTGLKMKHLLTGQERTVWHLQYTDWPEHGCPEDLKGFLSYLEEIQSVRRHTNSTSEPKSHNPPLLVHCSAGVGRTGVVILSEIMVACLEHNEVLDIPRVLDMLRQQRMMLVQTLGQYTFVYRVLIQFLKSSRLI
ncbi:tyrosine-protein phosphatase non-receptor type 21 [Mus musculus]|uniref:Tyrosine-protein phosphatase non-receptor type n=3 Tax=Mus musculus TaxID=10090 RepID=G5E8J4_MOUSE|nr:tyrosine-protein phosphatase non-receptor type 21 [Mus musculus]NP_036007.2 tyrosine-protein phosphatase non-receptor type 21 [Mus musculus]EDL18927.1 protein tyrosine phosphatase, non-receptor type 21, isoform CRA_a [Mus musculus]EDL18928.1 protein tyrosine phosphatase, non-receptor type 21, isoform CRA_a [Mus musculus]EDL18929.1 protein tyrosine phosphatase, non-receptor type 21, isoform CRA_a [Mus musculus]|eukprot:NP_001139671.1 tyrosine-protein phosphatase non-receptor type 21 [Mus musculus]